jgi:hypothetical protein
MPFAVHVIVIRTARVLRRENPKTREQAASTGIRNQISTAQISPTWTAPISSQYSKYLVVLLLQRRADFKGRPKFCRGGDVQKQTKSHLEILKTLPKQCSEIENYQLFPMKCTT